MTGPTADDLMSGITAAINAGDAGAASALLRLLKAADPVRAQDVIDVMTAELAVLGPGES